MRRAAQQPRPRPSGRAPGLWLAERGGSSHPRPATTHWADGWPRMFRWTRRQEKTSETSNALLISQFCRRGPESRVAATDDPQPLCSRAQRPGGMFRSAPTRRSRTLAVVVVSEWYRTARERPPPATGCGAFDLLPDRVRVRAAGRWSGTSRVACPAPTTDVSRRA